MQTAIKERPILFSGPMVRAILDGRKTQTRRIVTDKHLKRLGLERDGNVVYTSEGPQWDGSFESGAPHWCPYGQVGDRLWVRERHWYRATDGITTYADGSFRTHPSAIIGSKYVHESDVINWPEDAKRFGFKCVPSIHMPRWASRITLEITGVRVERLNDITEQDAIAEGCQCAGVLASLTNCGAFAKLWESINGAGSWAANPLVWVVEFQRKESAQ